MLAAATVTALGVACVLCPVGLVTGGTHCVVCESVQSHVHHLSRFLLPVLLPVNRKTLPLTLPSNISGFVHCTLCILCESDITFMTATV